MRILAIDRNSLLNRAFYGVHALSNKEGFPTNAVYGFVNIVFKQLNQLKPDAVAVAFDLKAPTFRHKMYPEYKAGRHPMPEELKMQMEPAKKMCEALGFTVLEKEGYEADDILGTIAQMADRSGEEAFILTGDRDSLQLISDRVHVLLATNKDTIDYDRKRFTEEKGIAPEHFVEVKALMGDSSDNIPGVRGVGETTAYKLIAAYKTLDHLYDSLPCPEVGKSVNEKLADGKDSAYMSRELSLICREVPLPYASLEAFPPRQINASSLSRLCEWLNFTSLMRKLGIRELDGESAEMPDSVRNGERPEEAPSLSEKWVGISLRKTGDVEYFDGEKVRSFPLTKENWERELGTYVVVCYDVKNLCKELVKKGIDFSRVHFDIFLAAYVVNSNVGNYGLERIAAHYGMELGRGNTTPVQLIYRLYPYLKRDLEESAQSDVFYTIEMPLAGVLSRMESDGFRIDRSGILAYGEKLEQVEKELTERIYCLAGEEFNIKSTKQLGVILFEKLRLPAEKKTKTGYSTDAEVLHNLIGTHDIIDEILEYRRVTKLRSTYVDGLLKEADEDGFVHTTFKQTGTATGRLSSAEPNLQNIPIRSELGRELRRFFIPKEEGRVLIDADYSQIELRLLAHISDDPRMIDDFLSGGDIHTRTASAVFGTPIELVSPELRKKAKAVNFGILYGMGAFSLAKDLDIPLRRAKNYIEGYLANYAEVDKYLKNVIQSAKEDGYTRTLFGRRRYIPELREKNKVRVAFGERVAMNSPIQGTAADIIKLAMIHVDARLREAGLDAHLILQVHDELILDSAASCAKKAAEILREEMEHVVRYRVPLTVELSMGKNWLDSES